VFKYKYGQYGKAKVNLYKDDQISGSIDVEFKFTPKEGVNYREFRKIGIYIGDSLN